MIRRLLLAAAILSGIGCADSGDFSWVTHTWSTDHGVFALDHVSRRKVDVTKAVRRTYLGETYYFENEENARVFDSNPWAYLYNDNVPNQGRPDRTDQN
jgi:YHS domain-containing protein